MRALLTTKAIVEAATGLGLAFFPAIVVFLLLGAPVDAPGEKAVCRIAGAALLAIGIACWAARREGRSLAAAGLLGATAIYDAAVVAVLLFARFGEGFSAIGLWPGIALHTGLGVWGLVCLSKTSQPQ